MNSDRVIRFPFEKRLWLRETIAKTTGDQEITTAKRAAPVRDAVRARAERKGADRFP